MKRKPPRVIQPSILSSSTSHRRRSRLRPRGRRRCHAKGPDVLMRLHSSDQRTPFSRTGPRRWNRRGLWLPEEGQQRAGYCFARLTVPASSKETNDFSLRPAAKRSQPYADPDAERLTVTSASGQVSRGGHHGSRSLLEHARGRARYGPADTLIGGAPLAGYSAPRRTPEPFDAGGWRSRGRYDAGRGARRDPAHRVPGVGCFQRPDQPNGCPLQQRWS